MGPSGGSVDREQGTQFFQIHTLYSPLIGYLSIRRVESTFESFLILRRLRIIYDVILLEL